MPGTIVDKVESELVGSTRTQGGEPVTVDEDALQTSVPTYMMSILSAPGRGIHTLTSVVKPLDREVLATEYT